MLRIHKLALLATLWASAAQAVPATTLSETSSTATMPANGEPTAAAALEPAHGAMWSVQGETFKLHQVGANAYRGIAPGDWDDAVHVANMAPLNTTMAATSASHTGPALDGRSFSETLCSAALSVSSVAAHAPQRLFGYTSDFVKAAVAATGPDTELMKYLNQPFVVGVATGLTGGAMVAVTGWFKPGDPAPSSSDVQHCSTTGQEVDVLNSLIEKAQATNAQLACFADNITMPGGKTATLYLGTSPDGCGIPNGGAAKTTFHS